MAQHAHTARAGTTPQPALVPSRYGFYEAACAALLVLAAVALLALAHA